mgnify:FL=1
MFEPSDALRSLSEAGRRRLLEIAKAEKALPWKPVDDRLQALRLVTRMAGVLNEPLADISANGWSVVRLMARQ